MKTGTICLLFLIVLNPNIFSQDTENLKAAVETFVPDGRAANPEWSDAYSGQLFALLWDKKLSPAALLLAASFCRKAALPEDPLLAAFMVYALVTETDLSLRSGRSAGETKVRMDIAWKTQFEENQALLDARRKSKKDLKLAGDEGQTLPLDKEKVKLKIDDKIKEKKEK